MYRDVWKLLRKDWLALLCSTLLALSPLFGAAVVWDVIALLVMATSVPVYSGRLDTPEPANPWLAAHLQDWMFVALAVLSALLVLAWFYLGPWLQMGIYGGLTDSLRGGKMHKADALMFRRHIRKAHSGRFLTRVLPLCMPVLLAVFWSILGNDLYEVRHLWLLALALTFLVRTALVFIPPLQADFPKLSGWELCDRSRELLRCFGPIRLLLWTLPGVIGYLGCSALFWVCFKATRMPIGLCLGWTLTALLTALPAMYTRAAVAVAYTEALRRENVAA